MDWLKKGVEDYQKLEEIYLRNGSNLSDFGNFIGCFIQSKLNKENTTDDFKHGVEHGISLMDGTHDKG